MHIGIIAIFLADFIIKFYLQITIYNYYLQFTNYKVINEQFSVYNTWLLHYSSTSTPINNNIVGCLAKAFEIEK